MIAAGVLVFNCSLRFGLCLRYDLPGRGWSCKSELESEIECFFRFENCLDLEQRIGFNNGDLRATLEASKHVSFLQA